jgi:hypothetical protein
MRVALLQSTSDTAGARVIAVNRGYGARVAGQ